MAILNFPVTPVDSDRDHATEDLRNRIILEELRPGARIPESPTCDRLGISRTMLRTALRRLSEEGLVTLRPGRCTFVRIVSASEISALFRQISALERRAAAQATGNMSIADRARLRRMHDRMIRHHRDGRLRDCFREDQDIHRFLVEKAGDTALRKTHAPLNLRARRGRLVALFSRQRWDESMAEHEDFMAALEARDAVAVGNGIYRHVARTGEVLCGSLADRGAAQAG